MTDLNTVARIRVRAVNGVKIPMENRPHSYIEQDEVSVIDSLYYQRRITDGDLEFIEDEPNKPAKTITEGYPVYFESPEAPEETDSTEEQ